MISKIKCKMNCNIFAQKNGNVLTKYMHCFVITIHIFSNLLSFCILFYSFYKNSYVLIEYSEVNLLFGCKTFQRIGLAKRFWYFVLLFIPLQREIAYYILTVIWSKFEIVLYTLFVLHSTELKAERTYCTALVRPLNSSLSKCTCI